MSKPLTIEALLLLWVECGQRIYKGDTHVAV